MVAGGEAAQIPLPMLQEHLGYGSGARFCVNKSTVDLVKAPNLQIAMRAYAEVFMEDVPDRPFRDSRCDRQILY